MGHFAFAGVLVGIVVAVLVGQWQGGRKRRERRAALLAAWGQPKDAAREIPLIASYHHARTGAAATVPGARHGSASRPPFTLDDRTWNDLALDEVFRYVDRTESVIGQQVLYDRLRSTGEDAASLRSFEELVDALGQNPDARIAAQLALGSVPRTGAYWIWSLALEPIERFPRWKIVYPVFAGAIALLFVASIFQPVLLLVALSSIVVGGGLRAGLGPRLIRLAAPFRSVVILLTVAERLSAIECLPPAWRDAVSGCLPALARLRKIAWWAGRESDATGNLAGLALEYLNLLFCLDANAAIVGVRELQARQHELHEVFRAVGTLDAALAIASLRTERDDWARPEFGGDGDAVRFEGAVHPLLSRPVANTITLGPPSGLLVTGANMTGKSTFLRTVGVNVVLAQAVNTAFARRYSAPWLTVGSCITPADDLVAGRSYYQAEVETIVALLSEAARDGRPRLLLFDELFRGTNTLDRIGGAAAVLEWLVTQPSRRCMVVAATHDLELATMLDAHFEVVHFADRLTGDGLQFDYLLKPGPTTTRNAIALLGVLGAPPEVVADALGRTDRLRDGKRG